VALAVFSFTGKLLGQLERARVYSFPDIMAWISDIVKLP
jgi:hypothetical protein